jgi:imidazolonepropionase
MGVKIHAGEFNDLGGIGVALRQEADSADHLDRISSDDIKKMAERNTVAVLLPGVSHFLGSDRYAPARALIDAGVPVALATDFNPGSSPCLSLQEIIALAVSKMKLTPEEALIGVTLNAAAALGMSKTIGSVEVGKQADLICLDLTNLQEIPYFFGANHCRWVVKRGVRLG